MGAFEDIINMIKEGYDYETIKNEIKSNYNLPDFLIYAMYQTAKIIAGVSK